MIKAEVMFDGDCIYFCDKYWVQITEIECIVRLLGDDDTALHYAETLEQAIAYCLEN